MTNMSEKIIAASRLNLLIGCRGNSFSVRLQKRWPLNRKDKAKVLPRNNTIVPKKKLALVCSDKQVDWWVLSTGVDKDTQCYAKQITAMVKH